MKRNIRLTIEYDGSRYQGWQRLGGDSSANTIQGKLEAVLSKMTGEDVNINGSGRTDAGVHAYGQVANFHTNCMMSLGDIKEYLTKYLPSDIGIVEVSEASERFHSRLNAKEKTYLYRIAIPGVSNVFERKYLWYFPETLDVKKMEEAASLLIGTHNFKGFSSIKKTKNAATPEDLITVCSFFAIRYLLDCHGPTIHTAIHVNPVISAHIMLSLPLEYKCSKFPCQEYTSGLIFATDCTALVQPPALFTITNAPIIAAIVNTPNIIVSVISTPFEPDVVVNIVNVINAKRIQML